MYYLAEIFPFIKRLRFPFMRDQVMQLMVMVNLLILGLDVYVAHDIDGTIKPYEWIPILYGVVGAVVLVAAGIVSLRKRMAGNVMATLVYIGCMVVGILGSYFHIRYTWLFNAPAGQQVNAEIIVWAPPLLCPITFLLVAALGWSATWAEFPVDSGTLLLPGGKKMEMPYSKTRGYFILVALFILITLLNSVLDHARTGFENPWLWLPTVVGIFSAAITLAMGYISRVRKSDLLVYFITMMLMVLVGFIGFYLHYLRNLSGQGTFVLERFLRGAPMLAPMLFANMAALGLIILLDPNEK